MLCLIDTKLIKCDVKMKFNSLISKLSVSDIDNSKKFYLKLENHKYRVDDVEYDDMEFLIQVSDGYLLRFSN